MNFKNILFLTLLECLVASPFVGYFAYHAKQANEEKVLRDSQLGEIEYQIDLKKAREAREKK